MKEVKKILQAKLWLQNNIGSIDIPVVNHCNLNCKGCDHFAPLAKEKYPNVEQYEILLKRLKHILHDRKVLRFNLMGGEPLLHPQIEDFCRITREIFPESQVCLVTNGLLLKAKQNLKNICEEYDVKIKITNYHDKNKKFYKTNLDEKGQYDTYKYCNNRSMNVNEIKKNVSEEMFDFYTDFPCTQLNMNGDYFSCIIPANVHLLNDYFGTEFKPMENEDYVNIFSIDDAQPIIDMNKKDKISFCRYCAKRDIVDWGISDKNESEWIK